MPSLLDEGKRIELELWLTAPPEQWLVHGLGLWKRIRRRDFAAR